MTQNNRAIIHVDMDAFYASVEVRDDPAIKGKPVIVGGLGRRGVVAAASYEARRHGVYSAMPIIRARQLCPHGVYVRPRMARYREVSAQIFSIFRDFTPMVEGLSLDEAFLDVTASLKLLGSMETIGQSISDRILDETHLQASIGMANNKFLAKLASDFRKPAGFCHIREGDEQLFLDPLPVGRLWGIGKKTEPRLRAMGILTIGQLRQSERSALETVLGNRTGHFLSLSRGEDERVVAAGREDKSISHEVTFDVDVDDDSELLAELQRQSEAVMRRVRRKHLLARTIHIKVRDSKFRTNTRSRTLRSPTASSATCYKVGKGLLTRWRTEHSHTPLRLLGIGVSGLDEGEARPGGIDTILDNINDRFGSHAIMGGRAASRHKKDSKP